MLSELGNSTELLQSSLNSSHTATLICFCSRQRLCFAILLRNFIYIYIIYLFLYIYSYIYIYPFFTVEHPLKCCITRTKQVELQQLGSQVFSIAHCLLTLFCVLSFQNFIHTSCLVCKSSRSPYGQKPQHSKYNN